MSNPTKELLVSIVGDELRHGGNPVARWSADHVVVRTDCNENVMPDKKISTERIDPIVSAIIAMSSYLVHELARPSVYGERGLIAV